MVIFEAILRKEQNLEVLDQLKEVCNFEQFAINGEEGGRKFVDFKALFGGGSDSFFRVRYNCFFFSKLKFLTFSEPSEC